jgi:hypothetical protein
MGCSLGKDITSGYLSREMLRMPLRKFPDRLADQRR